MPKRILFLTPEFPPSPGGIGNHGFNLINTLFKKGNIVRILTDLENAGPKEADKILADTGLPIIYMKKKGMLPLQLRRILKAFGLMRSFKPEIVICSGRFSLWLGRLLMFFFKKPQFICIIHGNEASNTRYYDKILTQPSLRGFKTVIAVSAFTQSLIQPKYKHQRHVVIPNAIDTGDLLPHKLKDAKKLAGNPSLLTVGNMTLRKGQHNVIKALPEILKVFPDAHYHCVGLKTRAKENMELAEKLGVEKHISFHGKLTMNELMAAYNACDVFVMLSETQPDGDLEGFGIAILEANFFGKPAIGSAGCGIEDAIDEGITGHKVHYNDPIGITTALKDILSNYAPMSKSAENWAAKHNWNEIADRYIELFK